MRLTTLLASAHSRVEKAALPANNAKGVFVSLT